MTTSTLKDMMIIEAEELLTSANNSLGDNTKASRRNDFFRKQLNSIAKELGSRLTEDEKNKSRESYQIVHDAMSAFWDRVGESFIDERSADTLIDDYGYDCFNNDYSLFLMMALVDHYEKRFGPVTNQLPRFFGRGALRAFDKADNPIKFNDAVHRERMPGITRILLLTGRIDSETLYKKTAIHGHGQLGDNSFYRSRREEVCKQQAKSLVNTGENDSAIVTDNAVNTVKESIAFLGISSIKRTVSQVFLSLKPGDITTIAEDLKQRDKEKWQDHVVSVLYGISNRAWQDGSAEDNTQRRVPYIEFILPELLDAVKDDPKFLASLKRREAKQVKDFFGYIGMLNEGRFEQALPFVADVGRNIGFSFERFFAEGGGEADMTNKQVNAAFSYFEADRIRREVGINSDGSDNYGKKPSNQFVM